MPIKQPRMITVINAGMNFKDAYESIIDKLTITDIKLRQAIDSEAKQLVWDLFFFSLTPFKTQVADAVTLISEAAHFRKNKRGNELRAGYQERKRKASLRPKTPANLPISDPTPDSSKPAAAMTDQEAANDAELAALWRSIKSTPKGE